MTGKKQVSNDEQDWGECNCTSLDDAPSNLKVELFCAHRLFVIAYLLLTFVVIGYLNQKTQTAVNPVLVYKAGAIVWAGLTALIALLHAFTIFDIKATYPTKD